jgi:hypothetical protein
VPNDTERSGNSATQIGSLRYLQYRERISVEVGVTSLSKDPRGGWQWTHPANLDTEVTGIAQA